MAFFRWLSYQLSNIISSQSGDLPRRELVAVKKLSSKRQLFPHLGHHFLRQTERFGSQGGGHPVVPFILTFTFEQITYRE